MSNLDKEAGSKGREIAASPFVKGNIEEMLSRKTPEVLTTQDELFVKEYLIDLNATAAWIRAGGNPANADKVGPRKAKKGLVSIAIARAMAERSKRVGISGDRIVMELARIGLGDPRVLFNPDGSLRAPTDYGADDAAMIEGIKTRRIVEADSEGKMVPVEIQEVKLASKLGALTALGRHLGIFNDKMELTVTTPLSQALDAAFKRTGSKPLLTQQGDGEDATFVEATVEDEDEHETEQQQPQDNAELREMLGLGD